MTRLLVAATILISSVGSGLALTPAEIESARNDCLAFENTRTPDQRIRGCTLLLEDQEITGDARRVTYWTSRARAYIEKKDYARAIADYTLAIAHSTSEYRWIHIHDRGMAYYAAGDYENALADLTAVIDADPAARRDRGLVYLRKKDFARAIQDLDRQIADHPRDHQAYYYRGEAKREQKDYRAAIDDYSEAIKLYDKDYASFLMRGLVYYILKKDEQAVADFRTVLQLKPREETATEYLQKAEKNIASRQVYDRAMAYFASGDYEKALAELATIIDTYPGARRARAQVYIRTKDFARAIQDLDRQIADHPRDDLAYYYRGEAKREQKDYLAAIEDYTEALKIYDKDYAPFLMRGIVYYILGKNEQAAADFRSVLRLKPGEKIATEYLEKAQKEIASRQGKPPDRR